VDVSISVNNIISMILIVDVPLLLNFIKKNSMVELVDVSISLNPLNSVTITKPY
jgi:hypothetical protein